MLSHSWTYQALVHDLLGAWFLRHLNGDSYLGIQLNRVTVEVHDDVEEDKSQVFHSSSAMMTQEEECQKSQNLWFE